MTSPRTTRFLGALALVAMAGLVAGAALLAKQQLAALTEAVADMEATNVRLRQALAQGRVVRETAQAGGAQAFAEDYLASAQDSVAAAELQTRLRALALERRVELSTLNPLTPKQSGDTALVGVRLTFRAPLGATQALLHAIETGQPILFVERTAIRADAVLADAGGEAGALLAVDIDVYAPKRPRVLTQAGAPVRIEPAPLPGARP